MTEGVPPAGSRRRSRIIEGRAGLEAAGVLYLESLGRLRTSAPLRRSLVLWSALGLVLTTGSSAALGWAVSPGAEIAALAGGIAWWAGVTAVVVGGAELLVTPDGRHIDSYGLPNGISALRAWSCLPLLLCAALPLGDDLGLRLWCAAGGPAGLLDLVDGYIARRWGPITELGKALDPFGDAVFFGMAAVGNILVGIVPVWLGALMLLRYAGPLLVTPIVFLMRRRPELSFTDWGRRNTALTGLVLFVCMIVRLENGPVVVPAIVLGLPLMGTTTVLHLAVLCRRVADAPVVRPRRRGGAAPEES